MLMQCPLSLRGARKQAGLILVLVIACASLAPLLQAYPPAPCHIFYGMLRDQYGTPMNTMNTDVFLETASGVRIKTSINPGIETAANYRLEAPMDAGLLAAPYQPTALRPMAPFRFKVRVAGVTYLPIEMKGDFAKLGQPGQRTRLNLTLGEDTDDDGLPDAWERLMNADITMVKPDADAGNGLNYQQTYVAGTYAISPGGGFELGILGLNQGAPLLKFLAVTGRTYTLLGSRDLQSWKVVSFRIPAEGQNAALRVNYRADAVKEIRVEAVDSGSDQPPPTYFRLMLQ